MAASYVNWMSYSQKIRGDAMQTQGNPVANHEVLASGGSTNSAPEAAQYARVLCIALSTVSVTNLDTTYAADTASGKTVVVGANHVLEIPNITRDSVITVTDV